MPVHRAFRYILPFWLLLSLMLPARAAEPPINPVPRGEQDLQRDLARLAKDPRNPDLLREVGMTYNVLGAPDNVEYLKKAKTHLEEANRLRPNDPYTLMFLGSTMALLSRSSEVSLFSKPGMLSDALALMDRAIQLEPGSYRLRLLRGTSSIAVPSMFARAEVLEQDIAFVRKTLEPTPPKEFPNHMVAAGHLLLGAYHQKKSENDRARAYFLRAKEIGKGTRYEGQAKKKLAELG